jgi:putative flippase GtrA
MIVIFQAAKFLLVGAFATVIDLKLFELLIWVFSFFTLPSSIMIKATSFIIATAIKYWGNKYWAFQKHEKEDIRKEMATFFMITLAGLIIDVSVFYCATKVMGPQLMIPSPVWIKLSVIFAALAAALCNFLGYKFLVFKK